MRRAWTWLALLALLSVPARADTLRVGEVQRYKTPSEALKAATDGDTVEIEEGEYYDCALVRADHLTIVGLGAGATFTDTTCVGKAELVVQSQDVTIKNITFTRARVQDGNGAGIRAEGRDLTLDGTHFINNQAAILAGDSPHSVITIRNSSFERNGTCDDPRHCIATLLVGQIARLHVEKSTLTNARGGLLVSSNARRTELYGNTIEDGPQGKSTGLVQVQIGALVMEDNKLEKTAPYANRAAAVFVLPADAPVGDLILNNNTYTDRTGANSAFLINYSQASPSVSGNVVPVGEEEISNDGIMRFHASTAYHATKDFLLDSARFMKRSVKILLGR